VIGFAVSLLSEYQQMTVIDMFALGRGEGGEVWKWRQRLLAWEKEMVCKCRTLLLVMTLHDDLEDSWLWTPHLGVGYIVRGLCRLLLKVSVFAWQFFWNRLPTKDDLFRRAIIPHDSLLCVSGCGNLKLSKLHSPPLRYS
jgi:hypothetical protein